MFRLARAPGFSPAAADGRSLALSCKLLPFRDGQRVAAVVVHIVGVPLDPDKLHLVRLQQGVERLPEVGVFQLALLAPPALLLPAAQPAEVDGVGQILTVRIQRHLTRLAQALQRGDRAEQLHAVVRRGRFAPE